MKKKFVLAMAIALVVAMSAVALVGCGAPSNDLATFLKSAPQKAETVNLLSLDNAPKITADLTFDAGKSNKYGIVYMKNTVINSENVTTYAIYNVAGKTLSNWMDNLTTIRISDNNGISVRLWASNNKNGTTDILDSTAAIICTRPANDYREPTLLHHGYGDVASGVDLIMFKYGNDTYMLKDYKKVDSSSSALNKNLFEVMQNGNAKIIIGKDIIVCLNDASIDLYDITNYGFQYSIDFSSIFTSQTASSKAILLDDQNVFIQLMKMLPKEAKKYDFIENDIKVEMLNYIVNTKDSSIKEVEFDYLLEGSVANAQVNGESYNCSFANYTLAKKIENNAYAESNSLIAFDNNMKVLFASDNAMFANAEDIVQVADDKFAVITYNSTTIINISGVVEKQYNQNLQMTSELVYGVGYRLQDRTLVDFAGKVLFNPANRDVIDLYNGVTFFSESVYNETSKQYEDVYYRQNNGEEKVKLNAEPIMEDAVYIIYEAKMCAIYDKQTAKEIVKFDSSLNTNSIDKLLDDTIIVNLNGVSSIICVD
ncbi:MAG: hypothetical protein RR454_00810 [Clostridia bacterium]